MDTKKMKMIFLWISIALLIGLIIQKDDDRVETCSEFTDQSCMGVPVISEKRFFSMTGQRIEPKKTLCMEGKNVPYDDNTHTIYLPCNVEKNKEFFDMRGELECSAPGFQLFFLQEAACGEFEEAVREGHPFRLMAIDRKGNYAEYHVVFTTLPLVELHGKCIDLDERDREIYFGEINVWETPDGISSQGRVKTCRAEWKIRGNTAMTFPKKSLKISLKNKNYDKKNVSFLGMEKDDDYILNPMWLDDLKVREMLAISLWNQMAEESHSSLKMSESKYCELIVNGEYQGLRLLQKKIEKKYLKLDESAVLFKGNNIDPTKDNISEDVFEIVYCSGAEEVAYRSMDPFLKMTDFSNIDLDNWVDLQLFLHLGNMNDNRRYKNIYYVLEEKEGRQTLRMLPWDTDMSFGVSWSDGFCYMPESAEELYNRVEYDAILWQYPQLESMLEERWAELRKTIFSEENIFSIIDLCYNKVENSGALERDFEVLEKNAWNGADTLENLKIYIKHRLGFLDQKYSLE